MDRCSFQLQLRLQLPCLWLYTRDLFSFLLSLLNAMANSCGEWSSSIFGRLTSDTKTASKLNLLFRCSMFMLLTCFKLRLTVTWWKTVSSAIIKELAIICEIVCEWQWPAALRSRSREGGGIAAMSTDPQTGLATVLHFTQKQINVSVSSRT